MKNIKRLKAAKQLIETVKRHLSAIPRHKGQCLNIDRLIKADKYLHNAIWDMEYDLKKPRV